jgi:transmembrane sensor
MAERAPSPRPGSTMIEAAEWFERLACARPGSALHDDFALWQAADPANAAAYADVQAAVGLARELRDEEPVRLLRRETARRIAAGGRRRRARMALAASIAAVISLSGMVGWRTWTATPPGETYQTAPGERSTVALADGSTMILNTRSRVRTEFSRRERRLVLESGEAIFEVAKDQRRPFVVVAGGQAVTAHGTVFDVRLFPGKVDVALLEGSISVKPEAAPEGSGTRVRPGQRLSVAGRTVSVSEIPKLEQVASWRTGIVIFEDTTLAAAVDEMNRYGQRPIRLDAPLADLRLSGSFRVDRAESFLEALEMYFPVDARVAGDGSVVLMARPGGHYARTGNF